MFIDVAGGRLYASKYGPAGAPAILGIGGWIGSSELWAEPFSRLSERWRTVAYDHRGAGLADVAIDSITYDNLVADVFAVMDACGIDKCTLAAESAGALTALGAALAKPERITRLVIVDGMFHRGLAPDQDPFLQGLHKAYPQTIEKFIQLCVPEAGAEHIKAWGRQILARARPEGAIALRMLNSAVDIRAELPKIRQPTLILHGELDVIVPAERAKELAAAIPGAKLVMLAGAGHVPTLTRPAEVAAEMEAFLK
jgi:pimeloyl-ACP methyl ester carboxylesterase